MARELLVSNTTGTVVYATIRVPLNRNHADGGRIGYWFNQRTLTFEVFTAGNWVDYDIALTELGTTGLFEGDMPVGGLGVGVEPEKALEVIYWQRAGATPAMTDTKITGSLFEFPDEWVAVSSLRV